MNKKPKIGLSIKDIFQNSEKDIDFDILEISSKDKNFSFNIKKLLKIKEFLKGKDLSMHTQTSRIFSCNNNENNTPEFNDAELKILEAEIIVCSILKVKELIIHLKQEKMSEEEKLRFKKLLDFSKKRKVEIIYESNTNFIGEICMDVLDSFPDLKYNLDFGHLNTAIGNKTLGMELEKFIEGIKDRVFYIHAHNNNGLEDEHRSLESGTLNWRYVLDKLDLSKIKKIIIELRNVEEIFITKRNLEEYLNKKFK
jgi:sugar phosphate isomerase/epimerase